MAPAESVQTGITYGIQIEGLVPFFEEAEARVKAGFTKREWRELRPMERAEAVAYLRLDRQKGMHEASVKPKKKPGRG